MPEGDTPCSSGSEGRRQPDKVRCQGAYISSLLFLRGALIIHESIIKK